MGQVGMLWMRLGDISIAVLEYSGTTAAVTRGIPCDVLGFLMNRLCLPGWAA
jgi:hypothetical protein